MYSSEIILFMCRTQSGKIMAGTFLFPGWRIQTIVIPTVPKPGRWPAASAHYRWLRVLRSALFVNYVSYVCRSSTSADRSVTAKEEHELIETLRKLILPVVPCLHAIPLTSCVCVWFSKQARGSRRRSQRRWVRQRRHNTLTPPFGCADLGFSHSSHSTLYHLAIWLDASYQLPASSIPTFNIQGRPWQLLH